MLRKINACCNSSKMDKLVIAFFLIIWFAILFLFTCIWKFTRDIICFQRARAASRNAALLFPAPCLSNSQSSPRL